MLFLSDVAIEDTLKVQAIFRFFFVYLTSRPSDTLKVQTDYLMFRNLITTSDTPKVQSSEAIAVEEYLLKLYAAIISVVKIDETPEQDKHRSRHYTKNVVLRHVLLS